MATDYFIEGKETEVGLVATDSGSLLIADGIAEQDLKTSLNKRVVIDVQKDNTLLPVIATKQNGRRFLLIPLDAGEPIPAPGGTVPVEDKLPDPEKEGSDD